MKNTLILFDINGTLIARDDRTDIPFSNALNRFLNTNNAMENVDTSARSDKDVFIEVLSKFSTNFTEDKWTDFLQFYKKELEKYKETNVWRENDTAIEFVTYLYSKNYALSLITGELSIGAKYKLEKLGIWKYFPCGGFGEDALKRFQIAEKSLENAEKWYRYKFENIYLIGDTVLDIQTANHVKAKSIAITTGSHSKEKLEKNNPTYLIDKFSEIIHLF